MWNNGDYIFKPGCYKEYCTNKYFDSWEKTIETEQHAPDQLTVLTDHIIQEVLDSTRAQIVDMVNKKFNLRVLDFTGCITLMNSGHGISCHTDHWSSTQHIPARGLIYLNPDKVFGTRLHKTDNIDEYDFEVGGGPGDLFIFKTSDISWHSVGLYEQHVPRYVYNMSFYTKFISQ